jgi:hypothetical protein
VLDRRANDGCSEHLSYIPSTEPGRWRRTPPFFRPPELPQWASRVTPFVLERPDQFRPSGPPALSSKEWAAALYEVKNLGGIQSTQRTAEQTLIAKFWSDFSYTETPPGHWNSIAQEIVTKKGIGLEETARLFALLNMAMVDAGIACWDAKFHFDFWRPVTAIQRAEEDGNAATEPDANWLPLLRTPSHPEYVSGHSTFSGAAFVVLTECLGTDEVAFDVFSDTLPKEKRHFTSIKACAEECGESRIYGGIHYSFACKDGLELGEKVGRLVMKVEEPES